MTVTFWYGFACGLLVAVVLHWMTRRLVIHRIRDLTLKDTDRFQ
jgi:hypothetical protein